MAGVVNFRNTALARNFILPRHQTTTPAASSLLTLTTPPNYLHPQLAIGRLNNRYFAGSPITRLPVPQNPPETMSNHTHKPTSNCPATLSKFLECNHEFASTCDPQVLEDCFKGQAPSLFWLGCSDSRVPEGVVIKAQPGEVFVHRNVANLFKPEDTSALAALAYAVNNLQVKHVVVVGHECCGGAQAALTAAIQEAEGVEAMIPDDDLGQAAVAKWIQPIKTLASNEIKACKKNNAESLDLTKLVKLNVQTQVHNVVNHQIIQKAWARGQNVSVHGWFYCLSSGKLIDLELNHYKP